MLKWPPLRIVKFPQMYIDFKTLYHWTPQNRKESHKRPSSKQERNNRYLTPCTVKFKDPK